LLHGLACHARRPLFEEKRNLISPTVPTSRNRSSRRSTWVPVNTRRRRMPYKCQRSLAWISVSDLSYVTALALTQLLSASYTTIPHTHAQYRAHPLLADLQTVRNWCCVTLLEHPHAAQDSCIVEFGRCCSHSLRLSCIGNAVVMLADRVFENP